MGGKLLIARQIELRRIVSIVLQVTENTGETLCGKLVAVGLWCVFLQPLGMYAYSHLLITVSMLTYL